MWKCLSICFWAVLLCSCSTATVKQLGSGPFVRKVDFSGAPETKQFAEQAQQIGNEMYPQICALLADKDEEFPRYFDFTFKKHLPSNNTGETRITEICFDASYLKDENADLAAFRQLTLHEMTHVAQHYYRPLLGHWLVFTSKPPSCWEEGMADYVAFKLGQTNGWDCPQCGLLSSSYWDGYACTGAFLLYLDRTYNSNIVRQLNTVLRSGKFTDAFFKKTTGKDLPSLWAEFKQTAAFTPNAERKLQLQESLGYVNGTPPKDIEKRFEALLNQSTNAPVKEFIRCSHAAGRITKLQWQIVAFLYFAQPGGCAETYMTNLKKNNRLPGFKEGERGELSGFMALKDFDAVFPASRTFYSTKQGDTSIYHYTIYRASEECSWQLQRAWKTGADGKTISELPIR